VAAAAAVVIIFILLLLRRVEVSGQPVLTATDLFDAAKRDGIDQQRAHPRHSPFEKFAIRPMAFSEWQ
jgi:hypothetical protein